MPQYKSQRVPKYRRQKRCNAADTAFVEIDGQRVYLGEYRSQESRERYARLLAERESGIAAQVGPVDRILVSELAAEFWKHAERYYRRPDGKVSCELSNYRYALRDLVSLYGSIPCKSFGPRALKTLRAQFVRNGWCRTNINRTVSRVKHVFRWGTENELVSATVYHALQAVSGLAKGRTEARENPPRRPVPDADIETVRGCVALQVRALIDLQLLSGARGGELVILRAIDIDTSKSVWTYRLADHKTAHHGYDRVIFFGPEAQQILQEFLVNRPVAAYLFNPRDAEAERHAQAPTHRRSTQAPSPRKSDRKLGECYSPTSYRRAIERACRSAKIPVWSPHRLRHNTATRLRAEFGLDLTQTILGHRLGSRVTELYTETNVERAIEAIGRVG